MEISPNPEESSNAVTVQVDVHHRHCSQLSAATDVATTNHVYVNETQATSDVSSIQPGYPKTAAERMREYRARKKKETLTVNHQKQKRSAAERAKEYRIRKKMKIHSGGNRMQVTKQNYEFTEPVLHSQNSDDIEITKDTMSTMILSSAPNGTIQTLVVKSEETLCEDPISIMDHLKKEPEEYENMSTSYIRRESVESPYVLEGVENYSDIFSATYKCKLKELQLKQKCMEEQNKKRKDIFAKALAIRTKQTAEELIRLEKLKIELQVLDSQFSQDETLIQQRLHEACLSYSEAEKQYLKVEQEFLQTKVNLQERKEKKELLTAYLCALKTDIETRKTHTLDTLMLELAGNKTDNSYDYSIKDENLDC